MADTIYRQAAIDAATKFRVTPGGEIFEAIRRAVRNELEALPSAQPEPCATGYVGVEVDYPVSVKQVLNITAETGALATQMRVRELPRYAQPERKKGEWIYGEHDIAMCNGYWCDQCGFFVPWDYKHKSIDFIKDYHWCPSCGADMRGKGD